MGVLMAAGTLHGGAGKLYVRHGAFEVGWPMAVDAGDGTMRSEQRELRGGVIEARQVLPGTGGVAGFAVQSFA